MGVPMSWSLGATARGDFKSRNCIQTRIWAVSMLPSTMPYILLSLKQIVRRLKQGWNMLKQCKSASEEYSRGTFALQKIGSLWDWWARWIQWHTTSTQWRLTSLAKSCLKCRYTFWTTKTFRYCRWHCLVIVVWCRSSLKFHVSGPCLINSKKTKDLKSPALPASSRCFLGEPNAPSGPHSHGISLIPK